MINFNFKELQINFTFKSLTLRNLILFIDRNFIYVLIVLLSIMSISSFLIYYHNGFAIAYNDARSHLDISRRVVENLKPGFAQLGSVWLPLPHFLMLLSVWNDFMWHSGLAGAIQSMISYVITGCLIFYFLRKIDVGWFGAIAGVAIFAINLNVLYLQSTAMTELLLIATMTAGVYEFLLWQTNNKIFNIIKSAFWIMLSTLIRYDGWFLFIFVSVLIFIKVFLKKGYKTAEGTLILFCTLAGFGVLIWLIWNQLIFKDVFYFISGPYAAATQQNQLAAAGNLPTKHNLAFSLITYIYAIIFNSSFFLLLLAIFGAVMFFRDKSISSEIKLAGCALLAPFLFNVLALYLGQSVLFVTNLNGSWFNVRYGLMMIPSMAVFIGFLLHKLKDLRWAFLIMLVIVSFFSVTTRDIVTLDDALTGSSGKNVKEVSGWLAQHAGDKSGFVLISVASHDAIIFSSGLPMSRFIHEGTGDYWKFAIKHPTSWARWIVLRTHDENDETYKLLEFNKEFENNYRKLKSYPFADIYEIKDRYVSQLHLQPVSYANKPSF